MLTRRWPQILIVAAVAVLVLLAFGHSIGYDFAPVDDEFLIVNNLAIRGMTFENLKHVFTSYDPELYIPVIFMSYQLNYMLGGLDPSGYHLLNLILHIINALLVIRIIRQMTGQNLLAIIAGMIFAVHPLNTEAVVWLAGRKDLLSALFTLLSFSLYLDRDTYRWAFSASIVVFLLALLSKVTAVSLLAIIVLHALLIERTPINRVFTTRIIPYALLSIIFCVVAVGGKSLVIGSTSFLEKVLVAPKTTVFYLIRMIIPANLTMIYPVQGNITLTNPHVLPWVVVCAAVVVLLRKTWQRYPWLTFAALSYVSLLAPTYLNIGKAGLVYYAVDRYAYVPMVFVLALGVVCLAALKPTAKVAIIGSAVIIALLTLGSVSQTRVWQTPEALFQHNIDIYPYSVGARAALANIYRKQNKLEEAFAVLKEGRQYNDHMLLSMTVGYIYAQNGQVGEAEKAFDLARSKDPTNPEPLFALASLYTKTNRVEAAVPILEEVISMDPTYVIARAMLGHIYLDQGYFDEALIQFATAIELNPSSVEANLGMARIYIADQLPLQAREYLERARALDPFNERIKQLLDIIE